MSFVLARCCVQTWVTTILMWAIDNAHAGRIWSADRRFPTPVVASPNTRGCQPLVQDTDSMELVCQIESKPNKTKYAKKSMNMKIAFSILPNYE